MALSKHEKKTVILQMWKIKRAISKGKVCLNQQTSTKHNKYENNFSNSNENFKITCTQ